MSLGGKSPNLARRAVFEPTIPILAFAATTIVLVPTLVSRFSISAVIDVP